ncbi:LptF/LptG family permease [Luteolibacter marinus]|uniref:LptF/LptG family permease n=1 Tax=Luteolibacter marinus TaxID=2776705 RepID=UPI001867CABB|nr:LptF/LptG family permease [Luteolibacter marinus]
MRLSDRYIGRQVLVGTLFAIILLSSILVLGSVFQTIRTLLVDFGAPVSIIFEFIVAAIPFSLIYTIPWAFLSAVLLVFGRLSSDNELIGFRVAGLSLYRLALPVFMLGLLLSGLCMWLNLEIAPKAKSTSKHIATRAFFMNPRSMLSAAAEKDGLARLEQSLENVRAYIEKSDGSKMEGLHLFQVGDPNDPDSADIYVHAMKAEAVIDTEAQQFRLHLYDAMFETTGEAGPDGKPGAPEVVIAGESVPVVLPFTPAPSKQDPGTMSIAAIRDYMEELEQLDVERVKEGKPAFWKYKLPNYEAEIQGRFASSFACLAFAFIGIPLGIKARRKDTSTGLILSLLIGAAYFICGMIGGSSSSGVMIAAWAPNVVCVLLGMFLLRRARFR